MFTIYELWNIIHSSWFSSRKFHQIKFRIKFRTFFFPFIHDYFSWVELHFILNPNTGTTFVSTFFIFYRQLNNFYVNDSVSECKSTTYCFCWGVFVAAVACAYIKLMIWNCHTKASCIELSLQKRRRKKKPKFFSDFFIFLNPLQTSTVFFISKNKVKC